MQRIHLHVKVVLDLEESEDAEKLAAEICRAIERVYGVRKTEVSSLVKES